LGILFPIATELITKNSIEKIKLLQNTLYKYLSILAISIGGLFLGGGPVIASILFGTKFLPSGELLRRIGPALIFNVLISINYGILAGRGMVKERVKIIGRALLVNIILNVITIVWLKRELYGAIIALTGGWILLRRLSYKKIHQQQAITFSRKYL
jgi:O-antigen/teichoic acid export membrane protein